MTTLNNSKKVGIFLLILFLTRLKINCTDNDHIDADDEEGFGFFESYIYKTMDKYSKNNFKAFPDPMQMNDMPFTADMGLFGSAEGVWSNMTLYGFSKLKNTISNVDFINNKMDMETEFPYHNIEGTGIIRGLWMGIIPYTTRIDQKVRINRLRHKSIEGVGQITIESLDLEILPEIPGSAIFALIFIGIYNLIVTTFTCLFIFNKSSKIKDKKVDQNEGEIPKIVTNGGGQDDQQFEIFKVASKLETHGMISEAGLKEEKLVNSH